MQNQKDTLQFQKDNTLSTDTNTFNTNAFSEFIIKKTEKLVTALYMVTDCLEKEDAMKGKLRTLGVGLLSDSHSFVIASVAEKELKIEHSKAVISEILSLINIANTMGFISEMNSLILKKEFSILQSEYTRFNTGDTTQKSATNKSISSVEARLDPSAFDIPLPVYKDSVQLPSQFWPVNISKGQSSYNTKNVLYKNKINPALKSPETDKNILVRKEERSQKMIDLIKQKGEVSIKDISFSFTDCSEKTIQRELNNLVSKGQLKKQGSKRWSRYSVN
jgi:hypothetical protein